MIRTATSKLSVREVNEMRSRYCRGESVKGLAAVYGVRPSTVTYHTSAKGFRSGRKPKIDMAALRQMVERGETKAAISRHFACSWLAAHNAVNRLREAA